MKNRKDNFQNNILNNNQKGSIIGGCHPTEDDFPTGVDVLIDSRTFLEKLRDLMIVH